MNIDMIYTVFNVTVVKVFNEKNNFINKNIIIFFSKFIIIFCFVLNIKSTFIISIYNSINLFALQIYIFYLNIR